MATQYTAGLSAGQVLTAGTMNSIGAAWETYTPTVTSNSGTLTSYTASGRWCQIQKTLIVMLDLKITNNGTGATFIEATLPSGKTPTGYVAGGGVGTFREYQSIGFSGPIALLSNTKFMLTKYDGTYPGGTNYYLHGVATFQIS